MTMQVGGTSGLTFPDASTQNTAATGFGFKNRIINGAMMIDQRNDGASVTLGSGNTYTLDRFYVVSSVASEFSCQQNAGSVTPPVGFSNYLGLTSLSAYSSGATDQFSMRHVIEGNNVADLNWGSANAKAVTLSFQVYSSLTGTFSGSIYNSAANRVYVYTYSVAAANTWTSVSVTIPGDTSGTWLTNSGAGITVQWDLGTGSTYRGTAGSWGSTYYAGATGSVSVVGTNGATFYITGVQLEKGSTATSFDYRPYGTELVLCQRYYQYADTQSTAYQAAGNFALNSVNFFTPMRASPTMTGAFSGYANCSGGTIGASSKNAFFAYAVAASTATCTWTCNYTASAEL